MRMDPNGGRRKESRGSPSVFIIFTPRPLHAWFRKMPINSALPIPLRMIAKNAFSDKVRAGKIFHLGGKLGLETIHHRALCGAPRDTGHYITFAQFRVTFIACRREQIVSGMRSENKVPRTREVKRNPTIWDFPYFLSNSRLSWRKELAEEEGIAWRDSQ